MAKKKATKKKATNKKAVKQTAAIPKSAESSNKELTVVLENMDREGQKHEKYKLEATNWTSNWEEDWGATFKGTYDNLLKFLTKECGLVKSDAVVAIKTGRYFGPHNPAEW